MSHSIEPVGLSLRSADQDAEHRLGVPSHPTPRRWRAALAWLLVSAALTLLPAARLGAASYTLSGSADGTAIFLVDDNLDFYVDGVLIHSDNLPPGSPATHQPINFQAEVGSRIRVRVRDTYGDCARLTTLFLTSGGHSIVADEGFDLDCGRPAGDLGVVHDSTLVVPDLDTQPIPSNVLLPGSAFAGVVAGPADRLYGVTYDGGEYGEGALYSATKNLWSVTILHSFADTDGSEPYDELAAGRSSALGGHDDAVGYLFGTTHSGGMFGAGTVFRFHVQSQSLTTLRHFAGPSGPPRGPLLQIGDYLYGSAGSYPTESTVFRIRIDGTGFQTLHSLTATEGYRPAALSLAGDRLYGTAQYGGDLDCGLPGWPYGCGTVFRLRTDGTDFEVLHVFDHATPERAFPQRKLESHTHKAVYLRGTTHLGPFSLTAQHSASKPSSFRMIYTLPPGAGSQIFAPPLLGEHYRLYISQYDGGAAGVGSVFSVSSSGTTTHIEMSLTDGGQGPYGILFQDPASGRIYGTTEYSADPPYTGVLFQFVPATPANLLFDDGFETELLERWITSVPEGTSGG